MKSIKELNEYCQLHNYSIVVHKGNLCGFVKMDYPVE